MEFNPNPNHRRAHLVVLTARGKSGFTAASRLQASWVNGLGAGLKPNDLAAALRIVRTLRQRLEDEDGGSAADGRLA